MQEICFERFNYEYNQICKALTAYLVVKHYSEMQCYLLVCVLLLFHVLTLPHLWNLWIWPDWPAAGSGKAVRTFCSLNNSFWLYTGLVSVALLKFHFPINDSNSLYYSVIFLCNFHQRLLHIYKLRKSYFHFALKLCDYST